MNKESLPEIKKMLKSGSHQRLWSLFMRLGTLDDYPELDQLQYVLSALVINPDTKNQINYSYDFLEGFTELERLDYLDSESI